jgi:outer membrane protein OmpA-like peptidoglycan-associated protein/YHS domain-containing protein
MRNTIYFSVLVLLCLTFSAAAQQKKTSKPAIANDSIKVEIVKLDDAVNSEFDDFAPVITADGSQMFFTSRRPFTEKEKKKNSESKERIYVASYDSDTKKWSKAEPLSENINLPQINVSNIAISNDGQRLLVYQGFNPNQGDIFESILKGKKWTDPVSIGKEINTEFHESSASISPDGKTIYFVSERKGGIGGRDIWKCKLGPDNKWGNPENLGKSINTIQDEEAVFIHPDGKTLFFSSKGHKSMGGYDIYKSTFDGTKWSKPQNLGEPINTIGDDVFFVLDASGKTGYYSSSRDSEKKNIYQINFIPLKKEADLQPLVTILKGTIKDAQTKQPVEAKIEIIDNDKNEVIATFSSNSESGRYLVSLPSGKNYGISVSAVGYLFHSENFTLSDTASYKEVRKNIFLNKADVGTKVVLRNIFFDFGKSTLRSESVAELNQLKKVLEENPTIKIEISGHTDNVSSDEYNLKLSENRAKAVVEHLLQNGVAKERLSYKGYGKSQPVASNDTEEGRQENRRVEFKILSK